LGAHPFPLLRQKRELISTVISAFFFNRSRPIFPFHDILILKTCVQYFKMICILMTDTCGSTIVVPLTYNRKVLAEQTIKPTYKSTDFPAGRTYPLVCNWNVQVFLLTV
jgi:hypothetical protein